MLSKPQMISVYYHSQSSCPVLKIPLPSVILLTVSLAKLYVNAWHLLFLLCFPSLLLQRELHRAEAILKYLEVLSTEQVLPYNNNNKS